MGMFTWSIILVQGWIYKAVGGGGSQSNMHVCGSKRQRLKRKQTLKIVCSWQLLANGIM